MFMTDVDIRKSYEKLREKYSNLPEYDVMNINFELEYLDSDNLLCKTIRRRMNERLIFFCRVLEGILYPQNQINMYESGFFDEEKKNELSKFYRKLMILERKSLLLDVSCNEREDINHIIELFNSWPEFKKIMSEVVIKLQEIWKSEGKTEDNRGYFG